MSIADVVTKYRGIPVLYGTSSGHFLIPRIPKLHLLYFVGADGMLFYGVTPRQYRSPRLHQITLIRLDC